MKGAQRRQTQDARPGSNSSTVCQSHQLFLCSSRRRILRDLWFGLAGGEAGVLIGDHGTGKTELCRELLRRLPSAVHSVYMTTPRNGGPRRLLDNISHSISIMTAVAAQKHRGADSIACIATLAPPTRLAIIIDDAHHMTTSTARLLAEWRQREAKQGRSAGLLLVGAPSLNETLAAGTLAEFGAQITMRCELPMFSREETRTYIDHWLKVCAVPQVRFSESAHRAIHYLTRGIPKKINAVCENAVNSAHEGQRHFVSTLMAARAAWSVAHRMRPS